MKILIVSDNGVPTGYGRIADQVGTRLTRRGFHVIAASFAYDGLLPAVMDGERLPYHVAPLQGRGDWPNIVANIMNVTEPDVVLVAQDAPYGEALRNNPAIDWSRYAFIMLTPVDGSPVYAPWIDLMRNADAALTISEFGVETFRKAGAAARLCRPGVDANRFFPLPTDQRAAIRERLGIAPDAFVLGVCAQNQGRKDIPHMIEGFMNFAADKPSARLLLDMEAVSPAGWDVPNLCKQFGYDAGKIVYRADALRAGVSELRDRMNVMDAHAVLSHREGYGLPLVEAMACGVVSIALDYCSGTEICGGGKGVLVRPVDYTSVSTWGGALDRHPDVAHFVSELQRLYDNPDERRMIARKGMEWARSQTWDAAADVVQQSVEEALAKRRAIPPANMPLRVVEMGELAEKVV